MRQQEILLHCVERGYYEIPRRSTVRSLASELGISATTLSLVLRHAERNVVQAYAQERRLARGATDGLAADASAGAPVATPSPR